MLACSISTKQETVQVLLTLDAIQVDGRQRLSLIDINSRCCVATSWGAVVIGRDGGRVSVRGRSVTLNTLETLILFSLAHAGQVSQSPGASCSSLLFVAIGLVFILLLVFLDGGCRSFNPPPFLPPLTDPLPPAVGGRFGQRLVDVRREEAVICGRKQKVSSNRSSKRDLPPPAQSGSSVPSMGSWNLLKLF